ncbi:MAG TPA: translation initiation factor IF-2 [Gemmatimonadaceae bacterium]|nr:translation initiation factor IF-2 [Gemmatimonadaceae bacterium]
MSKLLVNDMAGEFGISVDEVINLLRQMDVPVRSHLTPLSDDQVARIRARWEREKRARATAPAAAPKGRRRGTAQVEAPPPPPEPAAEAGGRRRRRAAEAPAPAAEPETIAVADVSVPEAPVVSRRRAAAAPAEKPAEADTAPSPVEKAPARSEEPKAAAPATASPAPADSRPAPARPSAPPPASSAPAQPAAAPTPVQPQSDRPRPRPIVPGAPRPRPVATGTPFQPPRPVASAAPGAPAGFPGARRDDRGAQRGGGGGGGGGGGDDRSRRGRKGKRGSVDQEAVASSVSRTMTALRQGVVRRGGARRADGESREELEAQRAAAAEREKKTVRVNEFITVSELAQILKIGATQIVGFAFKNLGLMVTINQRLDFDQIELIAGEFGFQAVREEEYTAGLDEAVVEDTPEQLESRPPVVTIMGHVDHGKTSLLDYVRKANVVAGESGGITQHIGAYHVTLPGDKHITFLDTPGHEAFTAMRARGAQVTDIVVLVVAADDQVMPQTIEAISHAKNAGVPMIVAINKIDLPAANPGKVKQDLLQHGVVLEEYGGTVLSSEISAKKGTNVDALLEQILLQAEILDLKANPNRRAVGAVIEASLDPGKGPVATILVSAGTLKVGDDFICGMYSGRVRALLDERGKTVKEAGPAIPVQILGIGGVPMAGDQFVVVEDAMESREIAQTRQRLDREAKSRRTSKNIVSLEDFMSATAEGEKRTLRIVIKADQGGPAEALADALGQLSNEEVSVEVIHRGVGAINEGDILLARASGAIIVGFHVRPDNNARAAAEREGIDIKLYKVIYEAVEDVRAALEGMLKPEEREVVLGEAEVRETFKVPRIGLIAGCSVRSGVINRQARARVIRDGIEIYDGNIGSLRRFKDDVREVREGFECGIGIENFNDIKVGDVIECYRQEQIARTLAPSATA